MRKVLHVAVREFVATVATKGFVIGVLITPLVMAVMIFFLPLLIDEEAPRVEGELAVLDPTGAVLPGVRERLSPEALARRRAELAGRIGEATPEAVRGMAGLSAGGAADLLDQALGEVPRIEVVELATDADLRAEKALLEEGGEGADGARLALAVIHRDALPGPGAAVGAAGAAELGTWDLYVREKLDDRIVDELQAALRRSLVDARLATAGLDSARIERLVQVGRTGSITVTAGGERATNEALNILIPAGFMVLLLVSVLMGGQQVMTTTIEEKSSRVVEVLLSAVSPLELMTGKIVGQMAVGLLVLGLYAGLGLSALFSFALLGLLDPALFLYLLIFFLLAYFFMGSFMAAIGAAVNELREAQTLMTPIMVALMVPWLLWMPITRDPSSTFAVVTSFVPPINCFVMLLRMTSTAPPPAWQVWLSVAIAALAVWGAVWFAAKVFRVGLLMHGKPPTFRILVRWVRMA